MRLCTQGRPAHIGQDETLSDELRPASQSGHGHVELVARKPFGGTCSQRVRATLLTNNAGRIGMRFRLTDEQQVILELIADAPLVAIAEIDPYTAGLAATKLIALADNTKWTITKLGEAMLERQRSALH